MRPCVLLLATLSPLACGGRVADSLRDAGRNDPSSEDADASDGAGGNPATPGPDTTEGPFPVCPATVPSPGTPCDPPGHGCAYVTQGGSCTAVLCGPSGRWQITTLGC
jgi:hypothetical protein